MPNALYKDRAWSTTTSTGTGPFTVTTRSGANQGVSVVGDGGYAWFEMDDNSSNWMTFLGQYTASGTSLAVITVQDGSNGASAVSWGAGTKDIRLVAPAQYFQRNPWWRGPYILPVSTNYSWVNQESGTVADNSDRMTITAPDTSATHARLLVAALPSTPYTVTMIGAMMGGALSTSGYALGLALLSSGNAIRSLDLWCSQTTALMRPRLDSWASATSFTSIIQDTAIVSWIGPNFVALRVTDNGTNRIWQCSVNGKTWATVRSEATNTGITPTQYGVLAYNNNAGNSNAITAKFDIYHLEVAGSILGDSP